MVVKPLLKKTVATRVLYLPQDYMPYFYGVSWCEKTTCGASKGTFSSDTMPAEIKVAMVSYYFKEQVSLCTTAMIFGVSLTNLSLSFRNVCLTIDTVMVQKIIKSPGTLGELSFTNEAFLNSS